MPKKKSSPKDVSAPELEVVQATEQLAVEEPILDITETIEVISSHLISFVLPAYGDTIGLIENVTSYTFDISTRPQSSADYMFRIFVDIGITAHFTDETTIQGSVQSLTVFKVLIPVKKDIKFKMSLLPPSIQQAAVAIAYSTTRGLIIAKSGGTVFQNAVLPIVLPSNLM